MMSEIHVEDDEILRLYEQAIVIIRSLSMDNDHNKK